MVSPDESDVVDFLESEFFQNLLRLRRGVSRLLHTQHHQQRVHNNTLALRESDFLLVSDLVSNLSGEVEWGLALLKALVVDEVALLLHVV